MPYVACPSCGERGKIPATLVGARIKCKKCGIAFNVAAPAAKEADARGRHWGHGRGGGRAAVASSEGIAIEGLDDSSWAVAHDTSDGLKPPSEQEVAAHETAETGGEFVAQEGTGYKEYKLLTPRDKIFDGKFDLGRLEEALTTTAARDGSRRRCPLPMSRTSPAPWWKSS